MSISSLQPAVNSASPLVAIQTSTDTFRKPKDWTLDDNHLPQVCPWDNDQHDVDPVFGLGSLDVFPLETLSEILAELDLCSLINFRRVNQRATQIVDSVPQYKTVLRCGSTTLRAILSIEARPATSCGKLLNALTAPSCEQCGEPAGYIYILTCSRVCFACFTQNIDYFPLTVAEAIRMFGLDRRSVACLPRMRSLPGYYSPQRISYRDRVPLVDAGSAYRAAIGIHGSVLAIEQYIVEAASKRLEAYNRRMTQRVVFGKYRRVPRRPPSSSPRDDHSKNPRRFMAIVRAPWVDLSTGQEDWGFHCLGCRLPQLGRPRYHHWRRIYPSNELGDHVRHCACLFEGKDFLRLTKVNQSSI